MRSVMDTCSNRIVTLLWAVANVLWLDQYFHQTTWSMWRIVIIQADDILQSGSVEIFHCLSFKNCMYGSTRQSTRKRKSTQCWHQKAEGNQRDSSNKLFASEQALLVCFDSSAKSNFGWKEVQGRDAVSQSIC